MAAIIISYYLLFHLLNSKSSHHLLSRDLKHLGSMVETDDKLGILESLIIGLQ